MENKNIACRIFKEQIDLVLALPEQDRAEVLYKAIISVFNQFENQNENAYVSVSDSVSIIGKKVFNLLEKNIVCKEFSNNYGGKRIGAGKKKTEKHNQIENQNDNQIEKQVDIQKEITESTMFKAGGQLWTMPMQFRKLAKKYWTESEIREIEISHSCHEDLVELSINDLLLSNPPKPKTTRFVKPTVEEIEAYCKERNNRIDPEEFFNHYEGNGWKVGSNSMKDWKAVIRTWEKRDFNRPQQPQRKNWSNYVGEGSFLKDPKDDPFYADIFNKKD